MTVIHGKSNILNMLTSFEACEYRNIYCETRNGPPGSKANTGFLPIKKAKRILNIVCEDNFQLERLTDLDKERIKKEHGILLLNRDVTCHDYVLRIKVIDQAKEGYFTIFNILDRERSSCEEAADALGYKDVIDFDIAYDIYGQEVYERESDGSKVISLICKNEFKELFDIEKFKQLALALMKDNKLNRGDIRNGIIE